MKLNLAVLKILILFLFGNPLLSQVSNNPFEIKARQQKATTTSKVDSVVINESTKPTNITSPVAAKNPFDVSHIPLRKQIKSSSNLAKKDSLLAERQSFSFVLSVIALIILAISLGFSRSSYLKKLRAMMNDNLLEQDLRNETFNSKVSSWIAAFGSIYCFCILGFLNFKSTSLSGEWFFQLLSLAFLLSVGKIFISKAIAHIFELANVEIRYLYIIRSMLTLCFPALISFTFIKGAIGSESLSHFDLGFSIFLYIILLFTFFRIIFALASLIFNNLFSFFLYLCALEILPVLFILDFWS